MELARLHTWDWEKWMKWNTPNTQQACRSAAKGHQIPHKVEDGSQSKTDHSGQLLSARRQITQDNCYQPEDRSTRQLLSARRQITQDNCYQPEDRSPRQLLSARGQITLNNCYQPEDRSPRQLLSARRQITQDNCYKPEDRSLRTTVVHQKTNHWGQLLSARRQITQYNYYQPEDRSLKTIAMYHSLVPPPCERLKAHTAGMKPFILIFLLSTPLTLKLESILAKDTW